MEDEPLEGLAPLRDDKQPMGRPAGDERFFDRATAGDQLLTLGQQVRRRDGGAERRRRAGPRLPRTIWGGTPTLGSLRSRPVEIRSVEIRSVNRGAIVPGTVESTSVGPRAHRSRPGAKATLASAG
jgi:hypothetical protein